jgi:hypothetical protein
MNPSKLEPLQCLPFYDPKLILRLIFVVSYQTLFSSKPRAALHQNPIQRRPEFSCKISSSPTYKPNTKRHKEEHIKSIGFNGRVSQFFFAVERPVSVFVAGYPDVDTHMSQSLLCAFEAGNCSSLHCASCPNCLHGKIANPKYVLS